jgi:hypothetical protein
MDRDNQENKEKQEKFFKMKLGDMDLSVRLYKCLKGAGVKTGRQLVSYHLEEFFGIPNFGKKTLIELEEYVRGSGCGFGYHDPNAEENQFEPLIYSRPYPGVIEIKDPEHHDVYVRIKNSRDLKKYIHHFVVEIEGTLVQFSIDKVDIVFRT